MSSTGGRHAAHLIRELSVDALVESQTPLGDVLDSVEHSFSITDGDTAVQAEDATSTPSQTQGDGTAIDTTWKAADHLDWTITQLVPSLAPRATVKTVSLNDPSTGPHTNVSGLRVITVDGKQLMVADFTDSSEDDTVSAAFAISGLGAAKANERLSTGLGEDEGPGLDYDSLLRADGSGMTSRLCIPSIDLDLPIYHGTSDETLLRGAGHLEGTSLPVGGGAGTHAVLDAHRGLAAAPMLTNLDNVTVGDTFTREILGEELVDRVTDNRVVDVWHSARPRTGRTAKARDVPGPTSSGFRDTPE